MAEDSNEEDDRQERASARGLPRFGSFVTIAAAILLLFGAAGRVGKWPESAPLFDIDKVEERRLQLDHNATQVILGTMPSQVPSDGRGPGLRIDGNATPPRRREVDVSPYSNGGSNSVRPPAMTQPSTLRVLNDPTPPRNGGTARDGDLLRADTANNRGGTYVVAPGDTWVKIAKATLGDASRWKELLKANPVAKDGLRVGMKLIIP